MKVLVIVDMQNDFITGTLGTPEAQAIVPRVCGLIDKGRYDKIYHTMDTHTQSYLFTHEGMRLPIEHCIYGTGGWGLELSVGKALAVKNTWTPVKEIFKEGFGSIPLGAILSACSENIERIDICGLCTDMCVVSNALILRSYLPETDIRVIASACAGTTPEMHQKALDVMRSCHIEVVE